MICQNHLLCMLNCQVQNKQTLYVLQSFSKSETGSTHKGKKLSLTNQNHYLSITNKLFVEMIWLFLIFLLKQIFSTIQADFYPKIPHFN
jgi:hypothetical protein